jgi:invasion protein IalB
MHVREVLLFAACALMLSTPGGVFAASDKPKPSPTASPDSAAKKEAAEPTPVSNDPQMTTASFGDWIERCQRVSVSGERLRLCEVSLTVTAQGQNAALAQLAIGRVKKSDPLRVTLVLPVNVGFPSAPKIDIGDAGDPMDLAWRQCVPAGCFAEAPFSADTQRAWREAKSAKVESKAANGQAFNFPISLRGLPQALDAMAKEP